MEKMVKLDFYNGKNVFVTGHTGFKGSWLCKALIMSGAKVTGYALEAGEPSLFKRENIENGMTSIIGDIRNKEELQKAMQEAKPEIVFHLAAQPIVRDSYKEPVYTYETNVMGTVNILEALRITNSVKSFINVTTDKVYLNEEREQGYTEDERLCGFDPYSNSKSCSELVTYSYKNSFFIEGKVSISTARSGNVIGGGDFANDRIIPDCIRAAESKMPITVRNPHSTRPYQHVLECLSGYLLLAERQYNDIKYAGCYNFGPNDDSCVTTGELVSIFCDSWENGQEWIDKADGGPHEANFLKLDCGKAKEILNWKPYWNIRDAVEKTVKYAKGIESMEEQICQYFGGSK